MVNPDIEIETLAEFDQVVARGSLSGYRIQSVNLLERTFALLAADTSAAVFLGCAMEPDASVKVRADGALVFPPVPDLPFNPYRGLLYTPEELFAGLQGGYEVTPDAESYAWFQETKADGDVFSSMLRSIHDDAISDALDEHLAGARVVGVMGGHAMSRGGTDYRGAAELGRALTRSGLTVATGGGPGAMEAANLGAYLAPAPDEALVEALELLAKAPSFTPSVSDWARAAFAVRERWPGAGDSVGIPTWFYGHEPPNACSTTSRSTSRTPPGRTGCWPGPTRAWSSCPARRAPSRRSSTAPRRTTTGRGASRPDGPGRPHALDRAPPGVAPAPGTGPRPCDGVPDRARRLRGRGPGRPRVNELSSRGNFPADSHVWQRYRTTCQT